jgi:5-oxoprolinase (ATP-hydrolysing)
LALPSDRRSLAWQFAIDRGGTFTDVVAIDPSGDSHTLKLLSASPQYADAAVEGVRRLLGIAPGEPLPDAAIHSIRMGTTVATNALLERRGDPTALVITAGLKDLVEIGTQARPDIFALRVIKPDLLHGAVVEADERIAADGAIVRPLDEARLAADLSAVRARGFTSVAIALMHAYAHPTHERRAAEIARGLGFGHVSVSHDVSGLVRLLPRADTTIADAYLSPVLRRYIDQVEAALGSAQREPGPPRLTFMASSGNLRSAQTFHGRDAILSGPAGGIVAMVEVATVAGFDRVIGFDMGGTSTDVSHYAGEVERSLETTVAGVRLHVPMLAIQTVAAGGGSILHYDGSRFMVGPDSAGADPGPACYRRGGPLTVTDANVMLGRLRSELFPPVFGPNADLPIDAETVRARFAALAESIAGRPTAEAVAEGFLTIAIENMTRAIRRISVERGYDATGYTLACFGAAGGQHACAIADALGMRSILIHPLSGVLSAYGMLLARPGAIRRRSVERELNDRLVDDLAAITQSAADEVVAALAADGVPPEAVVATARLMVRYATSETALPVPPADTAAAIRAAFEARHLAEFGFASPEKPVQVAAIEVEATTRRGPQQDEPGNARGPADPNEAAAPRTAGDMSTVDVYCDGAWRTAAVHHRAHLAPGDHISAPAIVVEPGQTVFVAPGWRLEVTARDDLVLTREAAHDTRTPRATTTITATADPALVELFNNRFMAIAEEMGEALRRTAQSVNIKERLDFSCAVFDRDGQLIANAPHVPVHLGSMDAAVEAVIASHGCADHRPPLRPGDSVMLNAPYAGGTHLPDITVVTPVFDVSGAEIRFWVASRGHHEDVGGLSPGSMTPRATHIDEEGVLIEATLLVASGRFLEAEARALLTGARYPARRPDQNIADLAAQVAANARGAAGLSALVAAHGWPLVSAYVGHVLDASEEAVRRAIHKLDGGAITVATDSGAIVAVTITVDRAARSARIDFTGTSPQRPDNTNAPAPVTRAAVLYCLRVLADAAIPLNAGCLRPIELVIPDGSMLAPRYPAAVVAGNTETSQVVTNAVFGALQALGSSQGTMNNLTFGDDQLQYYETICSGAPAGPGFDGAAAVQVHMTNTRMTDPEILELRYPVRVTRHRIRRGSGGRGRWSSGDGVERAITALRPLRAAILSGYRHVRPFGVAGGDPGACGRNTIERADGRVDDIGGSAEVPLDAGDTIIVSTPTGGGFGPASS